ncbi:MAG: DNA-directed RNA polymerase subunit beta, partial [Burkholderiaceae bacterium]|nr:DNA-directed RNA polymerase subunit beta [Burkholderiaceae bacterium]
DIPLMTNNGTFIVNGTERVIVSQLHRSPGVFFDHDKGRTHISGKLLYNARVIPYRGSWLDFEFDTKDILHVRIDRRRKMPATILLKALGYTADEILAAYYNRYYKKLTVRLRDEGQATMQFVPEWFQGLIAPFDIVHGDTVFVKKNKRVTQGAVMKMTRAALKDVLLGDDDISGMYLGEDVVDLKTGEVVGEISQEVTPELIAELRERGVAEFVVLHTGTTRISTSLRDTLIQDKTNTPLEAMIEIYKRLRPGDPPTVDTATTLFNNLFFNAERYDLSRVGRVKMNFKLGRTTDVEQKTLSRDDILAVVFYLLNLKEGIGDAEIDDIDHLGNRRVRAVGELVENQYRIGLVRMERAIRERMSLQEIDTLMPHDLINSKPVSAVIKEFFGSSQLSQFMDQTNPLSEVTHKRRLSALGPGGLTRERAGFEVRDVHNTHYGRICPVETPEGPNIGLIASLSTYARVNEYGFIETPYRPVSEDGVVSSQALFLSALEEERYAIAQANIELDDKGRFVHPTVSARNRGEFSIVPSKDVQYMDVSPNQLVSVAASLIPFLSHDDANRALMGANMQRQAVPLLRADAPIV